MPAGPGGSTTCTSFTYSAFGACQSNNTQTRTVLTSSPTGCTGGTPVLTQACTYVPPANDLHLVHLLGVRRLPVEQHADADRADLVPDGLHRRLAGPLAGLHLRPAGERLHVVHLLGVRRLPVEQHPDADRADLVPDGLHRRHAGHLPVVHLRAAGTNTCTSFTYSAFGACQSNNTQTRTVLTSVPDGLHRRHAGPSQACTYVPPAVDLHVVHLLGVRRLPVEQHADADRADLVPDGLHGRLAGPHAGLHLRAPGGHLHVVHLLGVRRLPVEQHADADRADLVPDGLHGRHAGPLAVLHLRAADADLHARDGRSLLQHVPRGHRHGHSREQGPDLRHLPRPRQQRIGNAVHGDDRQPLGDRPAASRTRSRGRTTTARSTAAQPSSPGIAPGVRPGRSGNEGASAALAAVGALA